MANRQPMSWQRAWKRTRAARRALEAERQTPGQGRVVDSRNGFWIVEQPCGSYTIQRGLRVRGAACGWTRQQAEAAAANGGTIPNMEETG